MNKFLLMNKFYLLHLARTPGAVILYTRGGQLVFDWDRLENFLITRDGPGGYKVTNTKYHEMQRFSFLFTF